MKNLLIVLSILILGISCNITKKVIKDPLKYQQVIDTFYARGGCKPDTILKTITKDSVVEKITVKDSLIFKDKINKLDTTISGIRIIIDSNKLFVLGSTTNKYFTNTITLKDTNELNYYKQGFLNQAKEIKDLKKVINTPNYKNYFLILAGILVLLIIIIVKK